MKPQQPLSKQEVADVFRRQSQDDPEGGEERIKGVGFRYENLLRLSGKSSIYCYNIYLSFLPVEEHS